MLSCPSSPSGFVGAAAEIADFILRRAGRHNGTGNPYRLLLHGPPGTGKSSLCNLVAAALLGINPKAGAMPWLHHNPGVRHYNGCDVSVDVMRQLERSLGPSMFSPWDILWIDEADRMSKDAQTRCLSLLDRQPRTTAILLTTNCRLDGKLHDRRLQSRFDLCFEVHPPTADEMAAHLATAYRLSAEDARRIADPDGKAAPIDVRQCLNDADVLADVLASSGIRHLESAPIAREPAHV